jgi:hypothetical protein
VDLGDVTWQGWDRDREVLPFGSMVGPEIVRGERRGDEKSSEAEGKRDTADPFSVLYVTAS